MSGKLRGLVVPLVTPLRGDGSVCEESVRRLIDSLSKAAVALLPALSSGEGDRLSERQWRDLVAYVVRHSGGLPVFPGALVASTPALIERAHFAAELGAAGITVPVPAFTGTGAQDVIGYFTGVTRHSPVPIFVYNQQSDGTAKEVIDTLAAICRLDRIVAIKESSRRSEVVVGLASRDLPSAVFQGWEDLLLQAPGPDGNAVALANLEAEICASMHRSPSVQNQRAINVLCERYHLFEEDWYMSLKTELWRRGILSTKLGCRKDHMQDCRPKGESPSIQA